MGSSAAWTVQLSGILPKQSNHNLEEQFYEGDTFMSYFQKMGGLSYLPGGIESGFRDVTGPKVFNPRLLQCKGDRYARVFEVAIEANSINEGDVFILDQDDRIYFWPGKDCNVREKVKALETADAIRRTERNCHAEIYFPREDDAIDEEFWGFLGGKPAVINPATSDAAEEMNDETMQVKLWKISNDTGKLLTTEITERPLRRDHLDTNDVFILELHKMVNIWIGKEADVEEKKNALIIGKSFVKAHNKPKGCRVVRTVENGEDIHFKSFFEGFYKMAQVKTNGDEANQDMEKLAQKKRENVAALMTQLGDNVTVKVYLCVDGKPKLLPESDHGHFFQDNVYAVDIKGDGHRYINQWFGPRLPSDQVSAFRDYTAQLTNYVYIPSEITRTSVMQGHEDDTFLTFFPNGFICHDGAYEPIADRIEALKARGAMFKVQGPFGEKPQAIQQDQVKCENLNSNEAFFVSAGEGDNCYAWIGEGASEDEANFCKSLGPILCPGDAFHTFKEGEETDDFWEALGGKTEYSSIKNMGIAPGFEPRLFQCTNSSGYFYMKEVPNFTQMDLNIYDVMVLDVYSTVYIWVGPKSSKAERENSANKVDEYIKNKQDGRDVNNVQVIELEPLNEPINFRTHFPEWEDEVSQTWLELDPYEAKMKAIADAKAKAAEEKWGKKEEVKYSDAGESGTTYELEILRAGIPDGVDPTKKEQYLANDVFESTFGMNK